MPELVCGTGDRDTWLAARREGITATDLPVILGLVTWDSPFCLYWRKKGKLPEVEMSDRMRLGSWLEQAIFDQWRASRRLPVTRWTHGDLYRNHERPWQMATLDYLTADGVLECKTSATRDGWGIGSACDFPATTSKYRAEHDAIPAHVRAQVLWQMDTLGVPVGHVAVVFLPSGEFRSYTISHQHKITAWPIEEYPDCPACKDQEFMRAEAFKFLANHLTNDRPPPVDGLQVTTDALRFLHAGAVKGKQAVIDDLGVEVYETACDDFKAAQEVKRLAENRMRLLMGDATLAADSEGRVVARREVFKRAAYEVGPAEVDRLVRVKPKEDKDNGA